MIDGVLKSPGTFPGELFNLQLNRSPVTAGLDPSAFKRFSFHDKGIFTIQMSPASFNMGHFLKSHCIAGQSSFNAMNGIKGWPGKVSGKRSSDVIHGYNVDNHGEIRVLFVQDKPFQDSSPGNGVLGKRECHEKKQAYDDQGCMLTESLHTSPPLFLFKNQPSCLHSGYQYHNYRVNKNEKPL
jgi:hypothetical protein